APTVAAAASAALLAAGYLALRRQQRRCRTGASAKSIPRCAWGSKVQEPPAALGGPFVLSGVPLGSCVGQWTDDYMATAVGDMKVSAHVSETQGLDFACKNFAYEVMQFREFLQRAQAGNAEKKYLYYRSTNPKRNKPSSLETIGSLAEDFSLPAALLGDLQIHSSVLRVATPGLRMWLHYDVCDNFLCCIRGRKRVVLLEPREVGNIYLSGSSS
ncbi:unnamed protein product, partial [Polarella glacialis]